MSDDTTCLKPHCEAESVGLYGIDLCHRHAVKVYMGMELLGRQGITWDPTAPDAVARIQQQRAREREAAALRLAAKHQALPLPSAGPQEWVYFLAFADRVKIGYTTNLTARLDVVPYDHVLAVIPGGRQDEADLHRRFKHLRLVREWFQAVPELMDYIAEVKAERDADAAATGSRPRPKRRRKFPVTVTKIEAS